MMSIFYYLLSHFHKRWLSFSLFYKDDNLYFNRHICNEHLMLCLFTSSFSMLNLFAVSQGGNQTMKKTFTALAASILLAGMGAGKASATSYEVKKGDSLWKIAKQYNT